MRLWPRNAMLSGVAHAPVTVSWARAVDATAATVTKASTSRINRIVRKYTRRAAGQVQLDQPAARSPKGLRLGRACQDTEVQSLRTVGSHVHLDLVASREVAHQNLLGQRVLDELLNGSLERTGTVLLVVAVLDQEVRPRIGELERQLFLGQPLPHVFEQHAHDARDVLPGERMEDDRVVQSVEELGVEDVLELVAHLVGAPLPVRRVITAGEAE